MSRPAPTVGLCLLAAALSGCADENPGSPTGFDRCRAGNGALTALDVPACLETQGIIGVPDRDAALVDLALAVAERDSLNALGDPASIAGASELDGAVERIRQFYQRGLFSDSARFHRMVDGVLVAREHVGGHLPGSGGRFWPATTPFLVWTWYEGQGLFFQPVNTVQLVAYLKPSPWVPTDSMVAMGEQLYRYALWREYRGTRFPVWEYEFPFTSGGVLDSAPWISGLAQGYAIILFAECLRRTQNPLWYNRAMEVLASYRVPWDAGGVLLPDTSHGYWWEEFNPGVRIFNGAAQAVMALGEFWKASGDAEVKRMFDRGLEAIKYYEPLYDTGQWTLYSRTQGYNTVDYHRAEIQIMDILYDLSGDAWFKSLADKWEAYVPPPGVP